MRMELVEPLRSLFKDEVRRVGRGARPPRADGLAPSVPRARASRSGSSATSPRSGSRSSRHADAVLLEEMRKAGLYRELWQCFAVLPAIRSVGVQGDERTYAYPDRDPRGHVRGRDDGRLGAAAVRAARDDLEPDRQRGARASTASRSTSPRSRPPRSSGSSARCRHRFEQVPRSGAMPCRPSAGVAASRLDPRVAGEARATPDRDARALVETRRSRPPRLSLAWGRRRTPPSQSRRRCGPTTPGRAAASASAAVAHSTARSEPSSCKRQTA